MVNARRIGRSSNRIAQQTGCGRAVAKQRKLEEAGRLGVRRPAEDEQHSGAQDEQHVDRPQPLNPQLQFEFDDGPAPQSRWVEVNAGGVRVENLRLFGGPWIALQLIRRP